MVYQNIRVDGDDDEGLLNEEAARATRKTACKMMGEEFLCGSVIYCG